MANAENPTPEQDETRFVRNPDASGTAPRPALAFDAEGRVVVKSTSEIETTLQNEIILRLKRRAGNWANTQDIATLDAFFSSPSVWGELRALYPSAQGDPTSDLEIFIEKSKARSEKESVIQRSPFLRRILLKSMQVLDDLKALNLNSEETIGDIATRIIQRIVEVSKTS